MATACLANLWLFKRAFDSLSERIALNEKLEPDALQVSRPFVQSSIYEIDPSRFFEPSSVQTTAHSFECLLPVDALMEYVFPLLVMFH